MCMGMHLARLEMQSLVRALRRRVARFELTAEPVIGLNNSIRAYPGCPCACICRTRFWPRPARAAESPWLDVVIAARDVGRDRYRRRWNCAAPTARRCPPMRPERMSMCRSHRADPAIFAHRRSGGPQPLSAGRSAGPEVARRVGGDPCPLCAVSRSASAAAQQLSARTLCRTFDPVRGRDRHHADAGHGLCASGRRVPRGRCTIAAARPTGWPLGRTGPVRDKVHLHVDSGPKEQLLDINAVLAGCRAGPAPLCLRPQRVHGFRHRCRRGEGLDETHIHLERFGAEVNTDGAPFTVVAQTVGQDL
jgi:hypothetical protein